MRSASASFTSKVNAFVAALAMRTIARCWLVGVVIIVAATLIALARDALQALERGVILDERSTHRKVLIARKLGMDRLLLHPREESLRQSVLGESLAIVREDRRNEGVCVGRDVQEPSETHVGLQAAAELALRSNHVKASAAAEPSAEAPVPPTDDRDSSGHLGNRSSCCAAHRPLSS